MGILTLLSLPVLGAPMTVHWLARKLAEEAEREFLDEDKVRGELLELQMRLDAGEITEEEYDEQERGLLDWLNAIREAKSERRDGQ